MEKNSVRVQRLLLLMGTVLILYGVCRLLFILFNKSHLELDSTQTIFQLLWSGMRFDLSAIILFNIPVIILFLLPIPLTGSRFYQKGLQWLFVIINSICLLANLSDIAYFPFVLKRAQADTLMFITGEKGNDLLRLLPSFFKEFWYLVLIFLLMTWLLWFAFHRTLQIKGEVKNTIAAYIKSTLLFLIVSGLSIIAIRGGFQAKPLNIIHASEMTQVKNIPAILNTPFSIVRTLSKNYLSEKEYFPKEELASFNHGVVTPYPTGAFNKNNVVIIIIESLSKKYVGCFGGKAHTPFLDSIFAQGYTFTNAFANGKESIQGIPAIISSIPSLQNNPFIFSPYASNQITSLAGVLRDEGYQTSFFHGGFSGTMGFDSYSKLAGFDKYYGQNEYGNDKDYDGHWGIWDEPFLQFMAGKLSTTKQPFLSTVFTLNTHNPFLIPEQYKTVFNKHHLPFLNCVEYMDYSLFRFFETIKSQDWFNNTLFVITADHTAPSFDGESSTLIEDYSIPITFYHPGNSTLKGSSNFIANQIDILPSVLDILNYPHPYYSMGRSLFSPADKRYAVNYNGNTYQFIDSLRCYLFNGEAPVAFYQREGSINLSSNLFKGSMLPEMKNCDSTLKKFIQFFNESMINNTMNINRIKN